MKNNFVNLRFKEFDVIRIQKLHANKVFQEINKGNKKLDFTSNNFLKERPAIILKTVSNIHIVIPLTTKEIKNKKMNLMLRTQFINSNFKKISYLMFDSIMRLNNSQILGLYKNGKNKITLSNSTKKWLQKEAFNKYSSLFT